MRTIAWSVGDTWRKGALNVVRFFSIPDHLDPPVYPAQGATAGEQGVGGDRGKEISVPASHISLYTNTHFAQEPRWVFETLTSHIRLVFIVLILLGKQ